MISGGRPAPGLLLLLLALVLPPERASAQDAGRWNSDRVLQLVERGRERRQRTGADPDLRGYRARAEGHVYFLVDQGNAAERTLVKADQLALEIFWRAPGLERQRIVGRRDERRLPTRIRYHLDHLTVVTDDFGDRITMGEGDEVRAALHPLAPGSADAYDFRLADSLTITFPPGPDSVRVYEVEIQPREPEDPGVVGSIFLDRATGGVVRFGFTFTPASYVDPQLDYIRVSLRNGLWEGRYWLPHRQEIEIRRELQYLDVPAGSVIRGRYEIGGYELNPDFPPDLFLAPRVTLAPSSGDLESYPFRRGLYAGLDEGGLAPAPDLRDLRRRAAERVGERYVTRVRGLRLHLPSASSLVRYNRVEGVYTAAGASYETASGLTVRLGGGYAFGRDRPASRLDVTGSGKRPRRGVRLRWNDLRDLGPVTAASGAMNSISTLLLERDYLDPYFATGLELFQRFGPEDPASPGARLSLRVERHRSASLVLTDAAGGEGFRPVRPVDDGVDRALELEIGGGAAAGEEGLTARSRLTLGRFAETGYAGLDGRVGWSRSRFAPDLRLEAELGAGIVGPDAPAQMLYTLGGRGTLPGHGYRAVAGNWYGLFRAQASWGVLAPWLRPRALAAVGAAGLAGRDVPAGWDASPQPRPRISVGLGAGLFWDVLRVEVGRGLGGGDWEANVTVDRSFWPWL